MSTILEGTSLRHAGLYEKTNIYGLDSTKFKNRYSVLSGPGSRHLLASPEVVGFPCYSALLDETVAALRHLYPSGTSGDIDILTILRGGLNYPLEEAAYKVGIPVRTMHFVSCERVIKNRVITGLDIRYEKVIPAEDRTIVIGDIIATGDTFRLCFERIAEIFLSSGGSIKRLIVFTIGGTKAIPLLEALSASLTELFPGFEGIDCFFYEGIFTVYEDKGASGINTPDIDFGWKYGAVSPDFRRYVLDHPDALLEKCIIYDGGARRYEIPNHFEEVLEYWDGILERAALIDPSAMVAEKLGYDGPVSFDMWKEILHYEGLAEEGLKDIWEREQALFSERKDLAGIAARRIKEIQSIQIL